MIEASAKKLLYPIVIIKSFMVSDLYRSLTLTCTRTRKENLISEWNDDDKKKIQYNLKGKKIIATVISYDKIFRVSNCKTTQEM